MNILIDIWNICKAACPLLYILWCLNPKTFTTSACTNLNMIGPGDFKMGLLTSLKVHHTLSRPLRIKKQFILKNDQEELV